MKTATETFEEIIKSLEIIDLIATPIKGSLKSKKLELNCDVEYEVRLSLDENRKLTLWLKSTDTISQKRIFWGSNGILATALATEAGTNYSWVVVDADDIYSRDLFASLTQSIVRKYLTGTGQTQNKICTALDEWSDIFLKNKNGLDSQKLAGLIGELLTLRDLATECGPESLKSWHGYEGERHDFRKGDNALEVKVTTTPGSIVSINGTTQLEAPLNGKLTLRFIRLENTPNGMIHLPALLKELTDLGLNRTILEENILKLGAKPAELNDATRAFSLHESTYYEIRDDFPRITPLSFIGKILPKGVSGLKYKVDLSTASEFALSIEMSKMALRSFK
jgi:hypothetical protein